MNYIYLNNIADREYRQTVGFTPGPGKYGHHSFLG